MPRLLMFMAAFLPAPAILAREPGCGPQQASEIIGTWRLVEASTTYPDGSVEHAYGDPPAGLFIYTPGGNLSLHLHGNPPPGTADGRLADPDLAGLARQYIGYYGRWSIEDGRLVHHIEGALLPRRIGQSASRPATACHGILEIAFKSDSGRRFYRRLERIENFE